MKRPCLAALAAAALLSILAAPASAQVLELGVTPTTPLLAPSCPPAVSSSACTIILTQVTALETLTAGATYSTRITKPGYLVAFTLGLSRLDKNLRKATTAVRYLNSTYGGPPRAGVTVLGVTGNPRANPSQRNYSVLHRSPLMALQPYLGDVVQFPIKTPLPVFPGQFVALTVPTWAPVLSFGLTSNQFAYRQSRSTGCPSPTVINQAQTNVNQVAQYGCNYAGTRVEYSVTEVTTPVAPKVQVR